MKFMYKYRRPIVIVLACMLIGMGAIQGIMKITFDSSITRGVEYVVMFGALYLLLVLPKQYEAKYGTGISEETIDIEESDSKENAFKDELPQKDTKNDEE